MSAKQKLKIKKGDQVVVIAGKDKGAKGTVLSVEPAESRLVVEGVNVVQKHLKPTPKDPQGGLRKMEKSIHVSNVALADPKDGSPSRVGYKIGKDGKKVRFAKKSGETIKE